VTATVNATTPKVLDPRFGGMEMHVSSNFRGTERVEMTTIRDDMRVVHNVEVGDEWSEHNGVVDAKAGERLVAKVGEFVESGASAGGSKAPGHADELFEVGVYWKGQRHDFSVSGAEASPQFRSLVDTIVATRDAAVGVAKAKLTA
jgi:hypothetical protein